MTTPGIGRLPYVAVGLCLLMCAAYAGAQDRSTDEDQHDVSTGDMRRVVQFRRPVALQLSRDGKQLVVANRKSGTISLLDTTHNAILGEFQAGLSDFRYHFGSRVRVVCAGRSSRWYHRLF